jgi:YegS/Rv2252/BmrU family lipid kinase
MGGEGIRAMGGEAVNGSRLRVLLLINEKSRQGDAAADAALEAVKQNDVVIVRQESPAGIDHTALIKDMADAIDAVIVGGGDGTLNSVAPALLETGLPLGILPLGTANDLARTLEIPFEVAAAAQVISAGHQRKIDLGVVNDIPYFNVASIGLSTRIANQLTGAVKQRWGRFGYALTTIKTVARMRPFSAEIHVGGKVRKVRTWQISVGNGRHYGGGMTVDAEAEINDGMLDLYSLEFDRVWKLALVYPAFRKGTHGLWREVRTLSCSEAEIRTRRPTPVNTDGEITTKTPARFRVLSKAVSVFVPAPSASS